MKDELEISVRVNTNYDKLHQELLKHNFEIKEEYQVIDNYLIDKTLDITSLEKLEILQKCVLVRDIVGIKKVLLYKDKKYDSNGNILTQRKIECPIEDITKAINFMEIINYKLLFKIYDKCITYANCETELVVQLVNDKYIFIEMESKAEHINQEFYNIEDMIKNLDQYNLPYSKDSYFVKKAELILEETINKYF